MHIPDGFLDAKASAGSAALSLLFLSLVARRLKKGSGEKAVPLLGVTSAFVFAGQMVNFPIPGGASGHLLGSALCAVVLGPALGALSMTLVLTIQCFLLQDGGITALGANILNMALIGTFVSYGVFKLISRTFPGRRGVHVGVLAASWTSVVATSLAASLELVFSSTAPFSLVVPAMVGVHTIIGIGEAVLTGLIVVFLYEADASIIMGLKTHCQLLQRRR